MMKIHVPQSYVKCIIASTLLTGLLSSSAALAQTPTYSYSPSSNTANSFPLSSSSSNKVQWVFQPSDFSPTPPGGVNITTIYIKPGNSASSGSTFTNLQIKMGTTTLSCLSSGTWSSSLATVYSATSHVQASWTSTGWVPITLTTPFFYNGTSNFIVEISQTGYTSGMTVRQGTITGCNRRKYGSATSTSSSGADTRLLVFGFDTSPANCSGTPTAPIVNTAAMSTAAPICANGTKALTAFDPNQPINGITYQWQTSTASTGPWSNVTSGSGATTLNYTTGPVPSTLYFRIGAKCTNSNVTTYSNAYQVIVGAPQPGTITGNTTFCPGNAATYSVPAVAGTTYTWTLPSGWTGTSTSSSIVAIPNATAGTISVTATSSCGTSIARTLAVTAGSAPAQPGSITGKVLVCSNSSQTYSVNPVPGATHYTWVLPSGWSGNSTTNTITTTTSGNGGTISVQAVNGCGPSTARTMAVSILTALANPGTITGTQSVCSGSLNSYSINPVMGATSYTWTFPSGWSGTTSGTSIQAIAGSTSGNINVTAFVSCATSPTSSKAITVTQTLTPAITVGTTATTLCGGRPITFTATPVNGGTSPTYQWKKNGVNVIGSGNTFLITSLATGDVVTVAMTSSYACSATPTVTSNAYTATVIPSVVPGININTTPTVNICAGTPLTFNTNITGGGPAPTYQWYKNGVALGVADSSYTDPALMDQDTITVMLRSNATCAFPDSAMSNKVLVSVAETVTPTVTAKASSTILNNTPITFTATETGGGTAPQYQWIKNGVDIPLADGDTYTATALNNGDRITVRMMSMAPCATPMVVTSNEVEVTSPLSVKTAGTWQGTLDLYPNPNTGHFTIAASSPFVQSGSKLAIDVLNTICQNVYHTDVTATGNKWQYDVTLSDGLANGHYTLRLTSPIGMVAVVPFIVNR